jgi:hypothetical protein
MCVNPAWFTIKRRKERSRDEDNGHPVMGKTVATHATKAFRYGAPTCGRYKELDLVTMPEPIPELGIDAGFLGTVDLVYNGGRKADVAVSHDGDIFGYVTVEADPEPHVVAYYVMEDD